jgi:hypothetical protein
MTQAALLPRRRMLPSLKVLPSKVFRGRLEPPSLYFPTDTVTAVGGRWRWTMTGKGTDNTESVNLNEAPLSGIY